MSFARKMRKKAHLQHKPVVEITATDMHFHFLEDDQGARPTSLNLALGILGYLESFDLTPKDAEHIKTHSRVPAHYIDEATRMKGVYSVPTDSVLFMADDRWTKKAKGAQLTSIRDLEF